MKVMERHIGRVQSDKWAELEIIEKSYEALEQSWGFPAKRRYRSLYGGNARDVYISEREWASMLDRETALGQAFASSEWFALNAELGSILASLQIEIYQVLE
jgi:hypothetical protein